MNNSDRLSKRINQFKNQPSPIKDIMNYGDPQYIQKSGIDPNDLISFAGGWSNHTAPENLRKAYENIISDPERFHFSGNYSTSIGDKEFRSTLCKFENYLLLLRLLLQQLLFLQDVEKKQSYLNIYNSQPLSHQNILILKRAQHLQ